MYTDGYGKDVWPIEEPDDYEDFDNKYDIYFTDDDEDYLGTSGSCSAHDCTGLIPSGESEAADDEIYKDLYQFGVPADDNYKNNLNNLL